MVWQKIKTKKQKKKTLINRPIGMDRQDYSSSADAFKLSNYRWYSYKILNDTKGNNLYLTWLVDKNREKMMLVLKRIPKN